MFLNMLYCSINILLNDITLNINSQATSSLCVVSLFVSDNIYQISILQKMILE